MLAGLDYRMTCASSVIALAVSAVMFANGLAQAQNGLPCSYVVSHIIQGPDCGTGGSSVTIGTGISPNGRYVVGYFRLCAIGEDRAFIYDTTTTQFSLIPMPGGFFAAAAADVNDAGIVVGTAQRTNIGQRGFVYNLHTGQWTELLPLPGGVYSAATGVNANDVVCGWRSIGPGINPQTAYRWNAATGFDDLGLVNGFSTRAADINDQNVVTGTMAVNAVNHPFLWEGSDLTDLGSLVGYSTVPHALNASNLVVGQGALVSNGTSPHAFISSEGIMSDLGTLPSYLYSRALDISLDGTVVGYSYRDVGSGRASIWHKGSIRDLNAMLLPGTNLVLQQALAIDSDGRCVVTASQLSVSVTVLLQPVVVASDVSGDCRVSVPDLLMVINEWGETDSIADVNNDSVVDSRDLMQVIREWTGI